MSANQLALALRVPSNRITAIVRGERSVTAETAWTLFWNGCRVLDESANGT
jgi:plasmid maintenance system antidote protein VapI